MASVYMKLINNDDAQQYFIEAGHTQYVTNSIGFKVNAAGLRQVQFESTAANPFSTSAAFTNVTAYNSSGDGLALVEWYVYIVNDNGVVIDAYSNGAPNLNENRP